MTTAAFPLHEINWAARKFLESEIDRVQGNVSNAEQALNAFRRDAEIEVFLEGSRDDPVEGVILILGVDELMDMARTMINVIGNCLATIVVARWEGEFDDRRARVFGTPAEAELDLKTGEVAFADAVAQGD